MRRDRPRDSSSGEANRPTSASRRFSHSGIERQQRAVASRGVKDLSNPPAEVPRYFWEVFQVRAVPSVLALMTARTTFLSPSTLTSAQPLSILERLYQRGTLLTTKEVMALLGVTRDTLCDWVRAGKIAAYKLPDGYKFEPMTVAAWLEARKTI